MKKLRIAINSSTNLFSNSDPHDLRLDAEERGRLGSREIVLEVAET